MIDNISLNQVRVFVAIAEAGSFRAAAGRLRRAQSAVSHAVADLEAELGVQLFDRSGYRPVLTDAGKALLEEARSLLMRVDFLRARADSFSRGEEPEVAIAVDTLFPMPGLCGVLNAWRAGHASVKVRMSVLPLGGPVSALLDDSCALALLAGKDFIDARIECEALMAIEFVAVASASHPLAQAARRGARLRSMDLADHLQIVQTDPSALSQGRDFGVLSPQTWRVDNQEAKGALIRAGTGWGRMPLWAVQDDLDAGRLARIPAEALGPGGALTVQTYLAWRLDSALGPSASSLREQLRAACATGSR